MTFAPWLRRHPLPAYFALTFGISWSGILTVLTETGFDFSPAQPTELGILFGLMLLGPSVSGLTLTALLDGRAGFLDLWKRLTLWKVRAGWYAVALLTAPLLLLGILALLSAVVSPAFAPRFQWTLFAVGLLAGSFEEIGWTGFATPRLLARHSLGMAGLSLGLIWTVWHVLADFRYNIDAMGAEWFLEFAIVYIATLTPYRVLMIWVYSKTQSLLLAILMHASFTGWLLALFPQTTLTESLFWQFAYAVILCGMVVVVLRRGARPHQPVKAKQDV